MMMISMHDIDELLSRFTFSDSVKRKSMHQVFEESPKETTRGKREKYSGETEIQLEITQVYEVNDHRQVDPPDDQWMCFSQHFHVTVAEKLCLPLIVNFLELHFMAFIRQK